MRVAHIFRKYNPAQWGGTETALQRLFDGLRPYGVTPIIYCPRLETEVLSDPLAASGYTIKRFKACVPILGLPRQQREQMIAVGGNLMSFEFIYELWLEPGLDLVHSHALGRLGGIGLTVAQKRGIPFVVTIHGGVLDLPPALTDNSPRRRSLAWEWGKLFGALLHSRQLLAEADAIITCNPKEAALLREKYPSQRIQVQPHGVVTSLFEKDQRAAARAAYPQICRQQVLLSVGRIDPVKNQAWLVERLPAVLMKHPQALLALAGSCTNQQYGRELEHRIKELGLSERVLLTGGLSPDDPRLIGLFQEAQVVLLPSISETFGLVLLEAWAAGKPVLSSRTSGASALVRDGENGFLFDLENPQSCHAALEKILLKPELGAQLGAAGRQLAVSQYDTRVLAGRMKDLYAQLMEEKHALRHSA